MENDHDSGFEIALNTRATFRSTSWFCPGPTSDASRTASRFEHLSEDVARRELNQSLNVRPVIVADGADHGMCVQVSEDRRLDLAPKTRFEQNALKTNAESHDLFGYRYVTRSNALPSEIGIPSCCVWPANEAVRQ
jgi:hypothetical protein